MCLRNFFWKIRIKDLRFNQLSREKVPQLRIADSLNDASKIWFLNDLMTKIIGEETLCLAESKESNSGAKQRHLPESASVFFENFSPLSSNSLSL